MKAIKLKSKPEARFHFGKALGAFTEDANNTQKSTSDYLHSDTLWSALVNAWALSCPETVEKFIDECKLGKFKLSSAFYCYEPLSDGNEEKHKTVFFLPKPVSLNLLKHSEPKLLKKVKFISKGIWESGMLPDKWFNSEYCTMLQNGSIVALKDEISKSVKIFHVETAAKTSARDISDREDSFYFQTDIFLSENVTWYFLIENNLEENLKTDFQTAMQTLVNLGVGGERSTGCGSLTGFEEFDFQIHVSAPLSDEDCQASVSLVAPIENELTEKSLYQIIKRGGRFFEKGKSLPMKQMLLEGAILEQNIKGSIIELNKNPAILRYGLSFLIPLHKNFLTF